MERIHLNECLYETNMKTRKDFETFAGLKVDPPPKNGIIYFSNWVYSKHLLLQKYFQFV